jgi:hypothetical protein
MAVDWRVTDAEIRLHKTQQKLKRQRDEEAQRPSSAPKDATPKAALMPKEYRMQRRKHRMHVAKAASLACLQSFKKAKTWKGS